MGRPPSCICGACDKCKRAAYMREWYRRPGNAERQRESQRRARDRNIEAIRARDRERGFRVYDPTKVMARQSVKYALVSGKLVKDACEVCGDPNSEAHHEDYDKPLEVRWLCRAHHGVEHRQVA